MWHPLAGQVKEGVAFMIPQTKEHLTNNALSPLNEKYEVLRLQLFTVTLI
jgi:hypothetical protein